MSPEQQQENRLAFRELFAPVLAGGLTVAVHLTLAWAESSHANDLVSVFRYTLAALSVATLAVILYVFEVSITARKAAIEDFSAASKDLQSVKADLTQRLDDLTHFRHLGNAAHTLEDVMAMARSALIIRNTFVWYELSDSRIFDEAFKVDQMAKSRSVTRHWLDANADTLKAKWIDIVSDDVLRSPKIDRLSFWASLTDAQRNKYSLHRLKVSYPIVNFMILEFENPNLPTKVIFGWGHHPHDVGGQVFESEDPRLVEMFSKYWQTLLDDSHEFADDSSPIVVTAHDVSGLWYRVAYEVPEDWQPGSDIPQNIPLKDEALVRIEVEKNRRVAVYGSIYEPVAHAKIRRFESVATDLAKAKEPPLDVWRLYFSTLADNHRLLAGFYQFAGPNGPINEFVGEYHDDLAGAGRKLAIFGKRLNSWLPQFSGPIHDSPSYPKELLATAQAKWMSERAGRPA